MSPIGTTRLCPDVRDDGEYWRVSGLITSVGNSVGLLTVLVIPSAD